MLTHKNENKFHLYAVCSGTLTLSTAISISTSFVGALRFRSTMWEKVVLALHVGWIDLFNHRCVAFPRLVKFHMLLTWEWESGRKQQNL